MSARRRHGTDEEDLSEGESEAKVDLPSISDPEDKESDEERSEESDSESEESVKAAAVATPTTTTTATVSVEAEPVEKEVAEGEEEEDQDTVDLAKSMEQLEVDDGEEEGEDGEANEDEDERHPAYIPRKGLFFLHDDRIDNEYPEGVTGPKMDLEVEIPVKAAQDVEEVEEDELQEHEEPGEQIGNETEPMPKEDFSGEVDEQQPNRVELDQEAERAYRAARKAEKMGERWSHDKYDGDLQNPRTEQELVDRYGFDIRNLNPDQIDFTRPLGQNGDETPPSSTQAPPPPQARRGGSGAGRGRGGSERGGGGRMAKSGRAPRQERAPKPARGGGRGGGNGSMNGNMRNNEDFPELTVSVNKKSNERQAGVKGVQGGVKSMRADPKTRSKPQRNADDTRSAKPLRPNKIESKRRESREKFKKAPMQREDLRQIQQQRQMQTDKRRNMNAAGDGGGYDQYERPPPDTRLRKQERRRRVEQEREHQLGPARNGGRAPLSGGQGASQGGRQGGGVRSPQPQRIQDPAPPIRSRRYSSDLSNEDIVERRRPPPPRRKKNMATSPQHNTKQAPIKPQLQAEIANVADILAKHENQARKMSQKHDYDARMRESPVKGRREDKQRKDDRRREQQPDSRNKTRVGGLVEEKSSKRYSARTRPEHWNSRQSPSPTSVNNDQNYNDRAQLPDDQVQDALEKHFNMSAPQAKKFVNQIKNQLHSSVPGEVKQKIPSKSDNRFPHGINVDPITSYPSTQDVKSNTQSFNAKMGSLRDRSNDQPSMQAYQAFQQQQQQQLQFIQQTQQNQHFANDALDMVTRMAAQQDPSFFANQAAAAAARQPAAIPPMYQQQSLHNNQMAQLSSPSGYVNTPSISQQQQAALAQANPLIANGTTYFHNNLEQHNRGKY